MGRASVSSVAWSTCLLGLTAIIACGSSREGFEERSPGASSDENPTLPGDTGFGGGGDDELTDKPAGETRDPIDCEEAKSSKSYVGCDYWPTVTPNVVWSIFDFAVVVANTGTNDAVVTVTGPNSVNKEESVPAGQLRKIYLPWVPSLKGSDADSCGGSSPLTSSIVASSGAYHLVSSTPVIVYQFSALQYKGEGGESPSGGPKDWSSCPASSCPLGGISCFSYSNDASLLLPSTAMTQNYRVTGYKGVAPGGLPPFFEIPGIATALSVTATEPDTQITLSLSSTAAVVASASGQIPSRSSGTITLKLASAGDVAQFVAEQGKDFSGSLVQSDKPVQVISSIPCISIGGEACDHIEETVVPAETLGKHYVITQPTGPKGSPVGHAVRLFGNQDGTKLTYSPSRPPRCPTTLNAGEIGECDIVNSTFEVTGDKEFSVSTFLLGATVYNDSKGDPSQTNFASVEQFRTRYIFLAPNDYPVLWADITAPKDAEIELDGAPLTVPWTEVGDGTYGVYRVDLTKSGQDGAHTLVAKKPVGVQVIGFGDNTSFQYPAGLNLNLIAPPPPPPK